MLKLLIPRGMYVTEVLFPPEAIPILLRVAVHEAGHAQVASHFGARVLGIALAYAPDGSTAMAFYSLPSDLTIQDICTICAAGSAGEVLEYGNYTEIGTTGDRQDLQRLRCEVPFEQLVEKAKEILVTRRARFDHATNVLRRRFFTSDAELMMGPLPNGSLGVFVMNENEFECMDPTADDNGGHQ